MITKRTLPGYIWFDGHTDFVTHFKEKLYWNRNRDPDSDFMDFLINKGRREKKLIRAEKNLRMRKKLDRVLSDYEQEEIRKCYEV